MSDAQEQKAAPPGQPPSMFRREAIEHHAGVQHKTNLLDLTSPWVHQAYRLLIIVCAIAVVFGFVARVNEYASGTAVITSDGRIDVHVHVSGSVDDVAIRPGQRVVAGQPLVRLYAADEAAELERIDREIEQHLVSILRNPGDGAAKTSLTSLQAQRELAQARSDERILRAPDAGVVSHVHVRSGQRVEPGDLIVSVTREQAGFRVVAVLPGQYRPLLRQGMSIRIELHGFPYAYKTVPIQAISDEVVGPAEALRYLPQSIADAVAPTGPMVFVEARLAGQSFHVHGRPLGFYDGMLARAEVSVRSERVLVMLIPGLNAL